VSRLPELETVVITENDKYNGTLSFKEVMGMATSHEHKLLANLSDELMYNDPINIQFTSGTTGNPKGATLSHHSIINNAYFVGLTLGYHKQATKVCIPVPLYHCFGMVLGMLNCVVHGACAVFPSGGFDAESVLQTVQDEKIDSLYGTPTMFIDVLNHPNFDHYKMSSLKTGIMAGSPCPVEVMKRVISDMNMEKVTVRITLYCSMEGSLIQNINMWG
jgi:fatty-acyl-CoA synthase